MSGNNPCLLVSVHDVAPVHMERLRRAEVLLETLGIQKVQYLFVREFHGKYRASKYPEFQEWCRRERAFRVSWWLHGYFHLEGLGEGPETPLGFSQRVKRRWLTAGEGEFLPLDPATQRKRIAAGLEEFSLCFSGAKPDGFVAPAWLFNPGLPPLLKEFGLRHTEDHAALLDVESGNNLPSPVITWATRTLLRKYGSLIVCPLRASWFRNSRFLRVALHPHDFDHPETIRNIESVLGSLRRDRSLRFHAELDWANVST